jgi:hypothetical protein
LQEAGLPPADRATILIVTATPSRSRRSDPNLFLRKEPFMRKRISPLKLTRETLIRLEAVEVRGGNRAAGFAGDTDGDSCVLSCPPHDCQAQGVR